MLKTFTSVFVRISDQNAGLSRISLPGNLVDHRSALICGMGSPFLKRPLPKLLCPPFVKRALCYILFRSYFMRLMYKKYNSLLNLIRQIPVIVLLISDRSSYCKKRLGNIFSNLFVSTCAIEARGIKHCHCFNIHTCSLNIVHSTFSKSVQNKIPLQLIHILSKHVFEFSLRPSLISPKVVLFFILIKCLPSSVSS